MEHGWNKNSVILGTYRFSYNWSFDSQLKTRFGFSNPHVFVMSCKDEHGYNLKFGEKAEETRSDYNNLTPEEKT